MAGSGGSTDGRRGMEEEVTEPEHPPPLSLATGGESLCSHEDKTNKTDELSSPTDKQNGGRKKRGRRKNKGGKHHRKWKPYTQLTWDERHQLEEREERRAQQKRRNMFAAGQAMAPYNTTQFLMDQHDDMDSTQLMSDLSHDVPRHQRISAEGGSGSLDSSDEYYDSPNDEEIFLEKDFTEAYASYHAERLHTLSKEELINEHLELEGKVEHLEQSMKSKREAKSPVSKINIEDCDSLKEEIARLKKENSSLKAENNGLRTICDPSDE